MNTLFEQVQRIEANKVQRDAVKKELLRVGFINRDEMYDVGLPDVGRIKNVGARIHELRHEEGWHIDTKKDAVSHACIYVLVKAPVEVTN